MALLLTLSALVLSRASASAQILTPPQCAREAKTCRVETPSETARNGGVFAISPNGDYVVNFRRGGGEIDIWDARAGERLRGVPVGDAPIERWAFSDDGARMKIAGRGRPETTIDLAAGAIAIPASKASSFQPWRSAADGRAWDRIATLDDGVVTAPVGVGAYVQKRFPWVGTLEYNECCNWSSVLESFALSDDGDYALAYLRREAGDRRPDFWDELRLYRLKDEALVAAIELSGEFGPITHFAADGRVAVVGDLWGGVTMLPLAERGPLADSREKPPAVAPIWAVLAPMTGAHGAWVADYMRFADPSQSGWHDDNTHDEPRRRSEASPRVEGAPPDP